MVWIALVLGVFLFYKFVERKHKILFLKIAGGLTAVGGIFIGSFWGYESWQKGQRKNGISVELTYKDLKADKAIISKLVDEAFNKLSEVTSQYYPEVGPSDLVKIKEQVFRSHLGIKDSAEYSLQFSDAEIAALLEWNSDKNKDTEKKLRNFENIRLERFLEDLPIKQAKSKTPLTKVLYASYLYKIRKSFSFSDLKEMFISKISTEDKQALNSFSELKESAYDELYAIINAQKDLLATLSFRICNKRSHSLETYSFSVSGFERGRATAQKIKKDDSYETSTYLNSDIIINPNECTDIQWSGDYKFYHRYEIKDTFGTWKN